MSKIGEELMSVIPVLRERSITYDLEPEWEPPQEDDYLVSIGKDNKPNTVYQIATVRLVHPQKPRSFNRWAMKVIIVEDMKPKTNVIYNEETERYTVMVDFKIAYPIVWHSRDKKK